MTKSDKFTDHQVDVVGAMALLENDYAYGRVQGAEYESKIAALEAELGPERTQRLAAAVIAENKTPDDMLLLAASREDLVGWLMMAWAD